MTEAAPQPFSEAAIIINGTALGPGHAMTLRIAVQRMLEALEDPHVYGTDEHAARIRQSYIDRLTEMQALLHESPSYKLAPVYTALDPNDPGVVLFVQEGREVGRVRYAPESARPLLTADEANAAIDHSSAYASIHSLGGRPVVALDGQFEAGELEAIAAVLRRTRPE